MHFQECLKLENTLIYPVAKPRDAIARERGLSEELKPRQAQLFKFCLNEQFWVKADHEAFFNHNRYSFRISFWRNPFNK
jgi:hypothetical protein